jgi:cell division transport system permease protein
VRALDYALREGWASLWRSRTSSAFAILAIALAMIVLGTLLLVSWNVERLLTQWASAAEFSVYLRDDASSEQRGVIETAIDRSGVIEGREFVSKADAIGRFRREFAELASLTESFDENPFPASREIRIRPEAEADGRAQTLVEQVASLPGVADVRYDRAWLGRLASGLAAVRGAGFLLAIVMGMAAAVTVASVVRLGMNARRQEIDIMELVGAPISFIRGPFVAEGVLQGGLGAFMAMALLWMGLQLVSGWWGTDLAVLFDGGAIEFLPARLAVALIAGGMAVGGVGGYAAARHAI